MILVGILSLKEGCQVKVKRLVFSSTMKVESIWTSAYKKVNFAKDIDKINLDKVQPVKVVLNSHKEEIQLLNEKVKELKESHLNLLKFQIHHVGGYGALALILVIGVILLINCLRKKYCKRPVRFDFTLRNGPRDNVQN